MKNKISFKHYKYLFAFALMAIAMLACADLSGQSLSGVNPDQAMQGQTLQLTVSGQNTNFMQGTSVSVNLRQGTSTILYPNNIALVSNTALFATFSFTYQNDPGFYDLYVWDQPDGEMLLEDAFEILENPEQPQLLSAEPNVAQQGQTLDVLISGQYTHFQASTTLVWLDHGNYLIFPQSQQIISETEVLANFSFQFYHPTGFYDVGTYDFMDGELILENGFFIEPGLAPLITEMQPSSGMQGTLLNFDIYAENSHFQEASYIMGYLKNSLGETFALDFDILDNGHLQGTIIIPYLVSSGNYNLHIVDNIDGEIVKEDAFTILENSNLPQIVSIEPDTAYVGDAITVETITENTWFEWADNVSVWMKKTGSFQMITSESIQIAGNQQLNVGFVMPPFGIPGYYDYYIFDELDGEMVNEGAFFLGDTITGINNKGKSSEINLYPNPCRGNLRISSGEIVGPCRIIIFNACGLKKEFENVPLLPNQPVSINIDDLAGGFYFVQIITNEEIIIKKLIKQ